MKRFLLPLATAVVLLTMSVAANAVTFAFYYDKPNTRVCLVPTAEFSNNPEVYWSAVKPKGKCDGPTPLGGLMNMRRPGELGTNLWRNLQAAAAVAGVNTNFPYAYCRQYKGNGSKIRFKFAVTESSTGEEVESGWRPLGQSNGCEY